MNKAEIAEERGLPQAGKELQSVSEIEVTSVFVEDECGLSFSLADRSFRALLQVSSVCDQFDLKVDDLDQSGSVERVRLVDDRSVEVSSI